MSVYHKDKCDKAKANELKDKVISLLKENDIDTNLLKIKALTCYGGDVRVYLDELERQSQRTSFRATGEREKQTDGSYRQAGTRGKHFVTERQFAVFNVEDFENNDKEMIDYSIYQIKRYLNEAHP